MAWAAAWQRDGLRVKRSIAYKDYAMRCRTLYNDRYPANTTAFWREVRRLLGGELGGAWTDGERVAIFPPLDEARIAISRALGVGDRYFAEGDGRKDTQTESNARCAEEVFS